MVYAHKVWVIFAIGRRHVVLPWGGHGGTCPTRQLSEVRVLLAELRHSCWVGGAEYPPGGGGGGGVGGLEFACEDLPLLLHINAAAEQGNASHRKRLIVSETMGFA
jgi:hypothetical protein